mmetsp:Transcript_56211/g.131335  ORF Transcript_56211/g.131335 Transcript_56211/m.131335 type:complete len:343 (+) Transcript_56211:243-1271(+)
MPNVAGSVASASARRRRSEKVASSSRSISICSTSPSSTASWPGGAAGGVAGCKTGDGTLTGIEGDVCLAIPDDGASGRLTSSFLAAGGSGCPSSFLIAVASLGFGLSSSSSGSTAATSLHSELLPVPPSFPAMRSQLSDSSASDSRSRRAVISSSATSGSRASSRSRWISTSPCVRRRRTAAARTGPCWPSRPTLRRCGSTMTTQDKRTFFTGSLDSRSSGFMNKSVKTCRGASRMMASHILTKVMRLRNVLDRAKFRMRCLTKLLDPPCPSCWLEQPLDPSSWTRLVPGSTNSSGAAAFRIPAAARAAASRTCATPSPQSCRKSGTTAHQVMSFVAAGSPR